MNEWRRFRQLAVSGLLAVLVCSPLESDAQQDGWEANVDPALKAALVELSDDWYDAEREAKAKETLRTLPDGKRKLLELFEQYYNRSKVEERRSVGTVLYALSLRPDLEDADVERFMPEARRILAQPGEPDRLPRSLVRGTFSLIQRYPTPQREEMLVGILNKHQYYVLDEAVAALGEIGTSRSLNALAAIRDHLNEHHAGSPTIPEIEKAIARIEEREKPKAGFKRGGAASNEPGAGGEAIVAASGSNGSSGSLTSGERWGIVVVLMAALAIVVGVWWRLRNGARTHQSP